MKDNNQSLKLWYNTPAEEFNEALPVGNGRMGGMVFGGTMEECIQLNEDTLWSGMPRDTTNPAAGEALQQVRELIKNKEYHAAEELVEASMLGPFNESYMPLGNILIQDIDIKDAAISDYYRELDLETAIATTAFCYNDNTIKREVFASYPDQLIVIKINAAQKHSINLKVVWQSKLKHETYNGEHNHLYMKGQCPIHVEPNYVEHDNPIIYEKNKGMLFEAHMKAYCSDGEITSNKEGLLVKNATEVTFLITAATSFEGYDKGPAQNTKNLYDICNTYIDKASQEEYSNLKKRHISDYKQYFDRVKLSLGENDRRDLPTNERLKKVKEGSIDPYLDTLYFQYGRYLLIASSRKGTQPAHLQGIWSQDIRPAWSSNWTTNINAQMNYWHAEAANLSELHEPLLDMIEEISIKGKETARNNYNCSGWVCNHNVDLWRNTTAVSGEAKWAYYPMAGVWLCQHLWEHYDFTRNTEYLLNKAYPIMKSAAEFCLDWLYQNEEGYLMTTISTSPENNFITAKGEICSISESTTMDIALITELFEHCISAATILKRGEAFSKRLGESLKKLPPFKVGKCGQLLEWSEEFVEEDLGHRHHSHLYTVYPSSLISRYRNQHLLEACKKSLEIRLANGSGTIGWSCAWMISLFARFEEPEKAYERLHNLIGISYDNLFDYHPPLTEKDAGVFQIDGNFGAVSGICEMLLQSHNSIIKLLPALPEAWHTGCVKGLRARGNIEADIEWEQAEVTAFTIHSHIQGETTIYCAKKSYHLKIEPGESYKVI